MNNLARTTQDNSVPANDEKEHQYLTVYVDNQSAIAVANNNKTRKRTKHIDVKYHYVREAIEFGEISTKFCPSDDNIADLFTKPLPRDRFATLRCMLGVG